MNTVFIVPTGIGCSIGGHAGDATPAFKLIASVSDIAITHPNVVNASDINEMPANTWYVEGSILDRFLEDSFCLKRPYSNKILLVVNKPIQPETINAVNAARHTIGCDIEMLVLETELKMVGFIISDGATGYIHGWEELIKQTSVYEFDALAIATKIEVSKEVELNYLRNGGINPWGGVEAMASKLIANAINKPVAHAPIESNDLELKTFNEVVNPRIAAEVVSQCYIHSVFKGLHKAPRISRMGQTGLSVNDIDCLITPIDCWGRPHEACGMKGIPIIAVNDNRPTVQFTKTKSCCFPIEYITVDNYLEAVGYIQLLKTGMTLKSI